MIHDDPRVSQALLSSTILGPADRAIATLWRCAPQSRTVLLAARVLAPWQALPASERRVVLAWLLIAAAVANLALTAISNTPPGWLWLVPPAAAVSVALLLMFQARSARA